MKAANLAFVNTPLSQQEMHSLLIMAHKSRKPKPVTQTCVDTRAAMENPNRDNSNSITTARTAAHGQTSKRQRTHLTHDNGEETQTHLTP